MHSDYILGLREKIGPGLLLMPGAGALVRNAQGHLLLQLREDDGTWSLPGGAVEPGETPARAVVREVREETGLRVRPVRLAGVLGAQRSTYPNGDEVEYTTVLFDCEVLGGSLSTEDPETARLQWFPPDRLPRLEPPLPPEVFADGSAAYFDP